jgi:catechol 2,3-dioxygenase-like lactoylglutathione lyase family enzyme
MSSAKQLRVSLTVDNFEKVVSFYRDVLGLPVENDWSTSHGKCVALSVEKATIEIIDHAQADYIDDVEVGRRVSGQVRLAFQFSDVQTAVDKAKIAGAEIVHDPVETPWKDVNARALGPDGMQITFFQSPSGEK